MISAAILCLATNLYFEEILIKVTPLITGPSK